MTLHSTEPKPVNTFPYLSKFGYAKNASPALPWLVSLARYQSPSTPKPPDNSGLMYQVEQIEIILCNLGTLHDRGFAMREKEILDGLNASESFEHAHKLLEEFLGYSAGKEESDGSPDPWWVQAGICFVFEDHAVANENAILDVTKARQVSTHPNWIKTNIEECKDSEIIPALVTPVAKIKKSAIIHLENVEIWPLVEFREWAKTAISTIRNLRKTFLGPGDLEWRANAADALQDNSIDAKNLAEKLRTNHAKEKLTQVD